VRALGRIALVLVAVVLLALGAAAWLLPRWLEGDAFRELLVGAARDATGRDVAWDDLSLALFPPRLVATQLRVGEAAAPLVVAERADLRIAVAPLLARVVLFDSLALEGVTWRVVRSANGVELPIATRDAPRTAAASAATPPVPADPTAPRAKAATSGSGPALRFAVRSVALRHSRIVWDDRAAKPPVSIEIRDVEGRAEGTSADAPADVSLDGALASGGTLRVAGTAMLDGTLDLEATLEGVDLAPFSAYFGRDFALTGRVGGTLRARGPAAALAALEADLEVADASLRAGDVAAQGPIALKARLHGDVAVPEGDFEVDATRAQLSAYGGAFKKSPGAPATASGKLVRDANGKLGVDSVRLSIKNMNGALRAAPDGLHFSAAPFDLKGWGEVIPSLAAVAPEGNIAIEGMRVATGPLALAGRVALDGVRLRPAGRAPIALRGALVGQGASIASEGLVAIAGGQRIALRLRADKLDGAPRHHLQLDTQNADARALLEALTGKPDLLEGPATIAADLAGPLDATALAGVAGGIDLAVGAGRIPRVSPLRAAVDGLAGHSESARLIDRKRAEVSLAPYLGDRFESITGHFSVGGGRARTDALVLRYPGYQLELRGSVGLVDQSLDLAGRIALEEKVLTALAERPPEASGGGTRVIEVARVRGTAAEPKLEIDRAGALAFAASFALAQRREKLERKLDKKLGEGSGGAILDALDQLLGKKDER
jgi:hypothetical protein